MKFTIPEWLKRARQAIAEKFLRASTPEERDAVIAEGRRAVMPSGPKSVMARGASSRPASMTSVAATSSGLYAQEIEEKSTEIAALSDKVGQVRAQISAASVQCEAAKARISALKARREDLIRETSPALVIDICASLGFDIEARRMCQLEREQKAKNNPKTQLK